MINQRPFYLILNNFVQKVNYCTHLNKKKKKIRENRRAFMVDKTIPRRDFSRESAAMMTHNHSRHFAFHMGQNDIQHKVTSFANTIDEM